MADYSVTRNNVIQLCLELTTIVQQVCGLVCVCLCVKKDDSSYSPLLEVRVRGELLWAVISPHERRVCGRDAAAAAAAAAASHCLLHP